MTIRPGTKFGHLIVLRTNETSAVCACICQHTIRASVAELKSGAATSCGCRAAHEERRRQREHWQASKLGQRSQ